MKDFLVKTGNPAVFDRTMHSFDAALIETAPGHYLQEEGCYILRVLGDAQYVQFVITTQGYGRVVRERGTPL